MKRIVVLILALVVNSAADAGWRPGQLLRKIFNCQPTCQPCTGFATDRGTVSQYVPVHPVVIQCQNGNCSRR